jgi:predicted DNA-binding transcriptional regulator YafY
VSALSEGIEKHRTVEIEYLKEGEETPSRRVIEPYKFQRSLPYWYIHAWDPAADAAKSFRLDRMRSATLTRETFQPRPGFDPGWLREARTARVWYSPAIARWEVERDARPLADGSALAEPRAGSPEWLVQEALAARGEAVVLEPADIRRRIAERARSLARELREARAHARA